MRNWQFWRLKQCVDRLPHEQQGFEGILRRFLCKPAGDLRFHALRKGVNLRFRQRNHPDGCSRWELTSHFWRNLIAECTPSSSLFDRETLLSSVSIVLFPHQIIPLVLPTSLPPNEYQRSRDPCRSAHILLICVTASACRGMKDHFPEEPFLLVLHQFS